MVGAREGHPGNKIQNTRISTGLPVCQATIQGLSAGNMMETKEIFRRKVDKSVGLFPVVGVVKVARQGDQKNVKTGYTATGRSTRCNKGETTRTTGRISSPLPRCSARSPSAHVCLLLEAAWSAVIGRERLYCTCVWETQSWPSERQL